MKTVVETSSGGVCGTITTISSNMPASTIIAILTKHQCPDITDRLDLNNCERAPTSIGGFGDVYRGTLNGGGAVAIKCTRLLLRPDDVDGHKILKRAARELYTWSRLEHVNIVKLLGLAQFRDRMAMISPWMENGTLLQHIKANLTEDRRKLCADISAGVAYLHQNEIIHGDIKSANVLVSGSGVAKLADFGCTELKTSTLLFTTTASSPGMSIRWAAPEILNGHTARSKEADVYALGMTFLEAVTGMIPFNDIKTNVAVCTAVVTKQKIPERPKQMHSFEGKSADRLWELMVCSWDRNPTYRPGSAAVQDLIAQLCLFPHSRWVGGLLVTSRIDVGSTVAAGCPPEGNTPRIRQKRAAAGATEHNRTYPPWVLRT